MYLCEPRSLCTLGSTNHCQRLATTFNMPVGCRWEGASEMNENMPFNAKNMGIMFICEAIFCFSNFMGRSLCMLSNNPTCVIMHCTSNLT